MEKDGLESNYCRNPGGGRLTIWCFTMDENKRWESCVDPCVGTSGGETWILYCAAMCFIELICAFLGSGPKGDYVL